MNDWPSFWAGVVVAVALFFWTMLFYNVGYENGQKYTLEKYHVQQEAKP